MSGTYVNHKPTYIKVFFALAILTAIEVYIPRLAHGGGDPRIALGMTWDRAALLCLAGGKAGLVGLFFMHLKYEAEWLRFIALGPTCLVFYAVFLVAEQVFRMGV